MCSSSPIEPQLSPAIRHRLREKFPALLDEDLPTSGIPMTEYVARIAARTGKPAAEVERTLYEIGVFVRPRTANEPLRNKSGEEEKSMGSGIPDETTQSGTSGLNPA